MKKVRVSTLITIIIASTMTPMLIFALPAGASAAQLPIYEAIDVGPRLRNNGILIDEDYTPKTSEATLSSSSANPDVLEERWWFSLDDPYIYPDVYQLWESGNGTIAEIWVQSDLSWPTGDPRDTPVVTPEDIAYLLEEFETNIYPLDRDYFGENDEHTGVNSWADYIFGLFGIMLPQDTWVDDLGRIVIQISNIGDDNYWDPTYPYYIAGFYSPSYEGWFDRNIINIDAYDWIHRLRDQPPEDPKSRPYLYESVIAHEFQHLIHDDYFVVSPDDTFMNEACSMFAEFVCNYPIDYSAIESFLYTPDNSLTDWGDQSDLNILADYGAVFLWAMYLYDHFGDAFLSRFVTTGIPGIEGINQALAYFGYDMTFHDIFHDWRIANLIRSDKPGHGKYNYQSLDLSGIVTSVQPASRNTMTKGSDFGETLSILGNPTGVTLLGTYGTDYVYFDDLKGLTLTFFDGDDGGFVPGWEKQGDYWWSGEGDLLNTIIAAEVPVDDDLANAFLELDTTWIIEDLWDYGFIQVATDGVGGWDSEWTSLSNAFTTELIDDDGHPAIKANLPGLTGSGSEVITFNLSAYAGQTIHLGFRFMTDWVFNEPDGGWWLYEALVSGEDIVPMLDYVYPEVKYMVTVVEARTHRGRVTYHVDDMWMFDGNVGFDLAVISKREVAYLIISPMMDLGYADYEFEANNFKYKWKW